MKGICVGDLKTSSIVVTTAQNIKTAQQTLMTIEISF